MYDNGEVHVDSDAHHILLVIEVPVGAPSDQSAQCLASLHWESSNLGCPWTPKTKCTCQYRAREGINLPASGLLLKALYSLLPIYFLHVLLLFFFLHCRTSARHGRSTAGMSWDWNQNSPGPKKKGTTKKQKPNKTRNNHTQTKHQAW